MRSYRQDAIRSGTVRNKDFCQTSQRQPVQMKALIAERAQAGLIAGEKA